MIEISKHMGGEAALPTNLNRAALARARPNYADCPRDASTVDKNVHKCMALWQNPVNIFELL